MTKQQLIRLIEQHDYILPATILKNTSEEDMVRYLEQIFSNNRSKIEQQNDFRKRYIELVNYLLIKNQYKEKAQQKKNLFDKNLINFLLSTPETT